MNEKELKRIIRAMNSCLNLYDVEGIPEELVDVLMTGVNEAADYLNLNEIAEVNEKNEIIKYLAPEDFKEWHLKCIERWG